MRSQKPRSDPSLPLGLHYSHNWPKSSWCDVLFKRLPPNHAHLLDDKLSCRKHLICEGARSTIEKQSIPPLASQPLVSKHVSTFQTPSEHKVTQANICRQPSSSTHQYLAAGYRQEQEDLLTSKYTALLSLVFCEAPFYLKTLLPSLARGMQNNTKNAEILLCSVAQKCDNISLKVKNLALQNQTILTRQWAS